jgi:hypothetical protein
VENTKPDLTTLDGGSVSVSEDAVATLSDALVGDLLTPESAEYNDARSLWNAMIDRWPGPIVDCRSEEDVSHAVKFAAEHGIRLSIFGAGHNIAGNAVCDDGLTISFRNMKAVDVDPDSRTVHVEPGATLGDLDAATQAHALAVPTGINSTTGNRRSDARGRFRMAESQVWDDGRQPAIGAGRTG